MPVGGPTVGDMTFVHHDKPVGVGEGQRLVGEFLDEASRLRQFLAVETLDGEHREVVNKVQELDGATLIVPPEKPAVPFGNNESGRHQARRVSKKPPIQRMIAIGAI